MAPDRSRPTRRHLLRGSLALAGIGFLSGCGLGIPWMSRPTGPRRIGYLSTNPSGRSAAYVDRVLKGANAAELPIEQPTLFDFVINLTTAQAIGLTIPESVLLQATEIIQ